MDLDLRVLPIAPDMPDVEVLMRQAACDAWDQRVLMVMHLDGSATMYWQEVDNT